MKLDLLIKGGLVYDGRKNPPIPGDVGIFRGRIRFVGEVCGGEPDLTIDARGLAVSPGFIDTHAHSDFTLVADPRAEGKICQAVTTEINGNCGMSAAPLYGMTRERREDDLRELGVRRRWSTMDEYFTILEEMGVGVNVAVLAGHGNIRGSVMGYGDSRPSGRELRDMVGLLGDTLEQGAIGLSTGLVYPPGVYSDTGELVELAGTLRERGLIYTSHMRSEGDALIDAVGEVIEIGRKAGVKVHISHIKTSGEANWQKAVAVCSMLEEARRSGVMLTCDRYPYTASATELDAILPSWVYEGGNEEEMKRLKDVETRARILREVVDQIRPGDYWQRVTISSVSSEANKWMEGKNVADISRRLGVDEMGLVFGLLIEEDLRVGAIFNFMSEENLRRFLALSFCMIGSDSSARCFDGPTKTGKPHPRTFGTFPRFFGRYVRSEGLMDLSEAVYRSTMLPARTFGLAGRGCLAEGMWADIAVWDADKIMDSASFDDPFRRPEGISYVLVNGVPALWEGSPTGKLAGKVLRHKDRK